MGIEAQERSSESGATARTLESARSPRESQGTGRGSEAIRIRHTFRSVVYRVQRVSAWRSQGKAAVNSPWYVDSLQERKGQRAQR